MILCDIGNTSFHFLINGIEKKYLLYEDLEYFTQKIYYISVNEEASLKLIKHSKECINLAKDIKINTSYMGIGIDRKMACYGIKNAVIIDAGSAISVDIIKDFQHQGGFILLGLKELTKTYTEISPVLNVGFNTKLNLDTLPLNTKDAVSYGILKSIILPIKEIENNKQLIFTGGDGKFLSEFFPNSIVEEHLIFKNMKRIINAKHCVTKR